MYSAEACAQLDSYRQNTRVPAYVGHGDALIHTHHMPCHCRLARQVSTQHDKQPSWLSGYHHDE